MTTYFGRTSLPTIEWLVDPKIKLAVAVRHSADEQVKRPHVHWVMVTDYSQKDFKHRVRELAGIVGPQFRMDLYAVPFELDRFRNGAIYLLDHSNGTLLYLDAQWAHAHLVLAAQEHIKNRPEPPPSVNTCPAPSQFSMAERFQMIMQDPYFTEHHEEACKSLEDFSFHIYRKYYSKSNFNLRDPGNGSLNAWKSYVWHLYQHHCIQPHLEEWESRNNKEFYAQEDRARMMVKRLFY